MPKWGLSEEQAKSEPWGLDPKALRPAKTNTDPVHEAVYVNELERQIIDSRSFQRLRRVRQLGSAHLVYPGATHTRFQHSLGALKVVQDIVDNAHDNPINRKLRDDLLSEWQRDLPPEIYTKQLAEVTVLARLGALLHDLCHVPYGHTVEDDYGLLQPHDKNIDRFEAFWQSVQHATKGQVTAELKDELQRLILSKVEVASDSRYPFVGDMVGNTICADLIDYLWRDYYFTGLPGRLGQRFLSYFFITGSSEGPYARRMALRIEKDGRERADVISEVFKYLRYRYELGERVLQHHAKVAADVMIGKAVEMWKQHAGEEAVELAFRKHSDDGILDHLADAALGGASELAADVRDRRLYKEHARSKSEDTYLKQGPLFGVWRDPVQRHAIEKRVSDAPQLGEEWRVLLSIPNPKMRLKAADVLVATHGVVTKLSEWDLNHGERAKDLIESHKRLWCVQLFVHPALSDEDRDRAAAYLADELRLTWDRKPSAYPVSSVIEQALTEISRERPLSEAQKDEARAAVHRQGPREETFAEVKSRVERSLAGDATAAQPGSGRGRRTSVRREPSPPHSGSDATEGLL